MEGKGSPSCSKERHGEDVCVHCKRQGAAAGNLTAETWQSWHSHSTPTLVLSPKGKAEKAFQGAKLHTVCSPTSSHQVGGVFPTAWMSGGGGNRKSLS